MTPTPIYAPIGIFFYLFCFSWYSESFILKCSALFFICNNLPSHLIQHGVPMVEIPFFADQPENLIWVETRKFGVSLQLKQIKVETLVLEMKEVMEESGVYKSAAVADSIIRRTHPLTPAQQLVGWTKYILQMGDAGHLKPHTFQQPWHEQYLLGVLLFLLVVTLGTMWLCGKLLGLVARWLCGARKLKEA
uniref:glucuronosyltransferase n=1 Tax=Sus scrofa TaxID=9823 RepID=A0A8D1P9D9_PIG